MASEPFEFNAELSRSRRILSNDETSEQRIWQRDRKQKGERLSAQVMG